MPEKLTVTNREALDIAAGLKRLDGIMAGTEFQPFEMDVSTVWNIAKNSAIFDRVQQTFEQAQRALAKQHGIFDGDRLSPGMAQKFATYQDSVAELKDATSEVSGVLLIPLSKLFNKPKDTPSKMKTNAIPTTVLKQIMPIIKEDCELG